MENKKIYIGFEMKDEKAVQDFNEYQKKLAADPDFAKVVQEAKSEDQVYEYMKEKATKRGKLAPLMSEESKKSAGIYLVHG